MRVVYIVGRVKDIVPKLLYIFPQIGSQVVLFLILGPHGLRSLVRHVESLAGVGQLLFDPVPPRACGQAVDAGSGQTCDRGVTEFVRFGFDRDDDVGAPRRPGEQPEGMWSAFPSVGYTEIRVNIR